jgi:uracil-DNA glycosylase
MEMLGRQHMAHLTTYVEELRLSTGLDGLIPYFDPLDGGTDARCLFLFEAAGPGAVASGFISRNNDDSAKNFFDLNRQVRLDRTHTVS